LKQVVRRYYKVLNNLKTDMDPSALAALLTNDCKCQEQVKSIRSVKAEGNHYTQQYTIKNLAPGVSNATHGTVLANMAVSTGGIADAHGHYVSRSKADPDYSDEFRLVKKDGRWLIYEIAFLK
jgi:hypothetical protein